MEEKQSELALVSLFQKVFINKDLMRKRKLLVKALGGDLPFGFLSFSTDSISGQKDKEFSNKTL
ncbi:MAG: hypothetical protein N3B16_12160 [Candidatus Aminicenantes bacterium]|nr:hypothetical protein [Candidatus Aminicenantes bacterium]